MDRRLFLNQSVAGLALQFLPIHLFATSSAGKQAVLLTEPNSIAQEIVTALQAGLIGQPERLTITHVYSPELTPKLALLALVKQDFAWAGQLIGTNLQIDSERLFVHSSSAEFGSYSTRFTSSNLMVVWQGLARVGRQVQANTTTGLIRLMGSKGALQIAGDKQSYRFIDLNGRITQVT